MKTNEKSYTEIGRYLVVDPEICHGKLYPLGEPISELTE